MNYKPICANTNIERFSQYLLQAREHGHVGRQTIEQLRDSGNVVTQDAAHQVFHQLRISL